MTEFCDSFMHNLWFYMYTCNLFKDDEIRIVWYNIHKRTVLSHRSLNACMWYLEGL